MNTGRPLITIVVPVFNERDNLGPFYEAATAVMRSLLDYDWEFVALCGPLFFVTGFLLTTGREPVRGRHPVWALAIVLVVWAGLYSIAAPRVAAWGAPLPVQAARLGWVQPLVPAPIEPTPDVSAPASRPTPGTRTKPGMTGR